jgi:hypothetical protein
MNSGAGITEIKKPGDPDLTKKEAEEWYKIWVQEGKSDAEGHRTSNMVQVLLSTFHDRRAAISNSCLGGAYTRLRVQ